MSFIMRVICCPPSSGKSSGTASDFHAELECLFIEASISDIPTVVVGDFNVHFDVETKSEPLYNQPTNLQFITTRPFNDS